MDIHPPNPALDATLIILAELYATGVLELHSLNTIADRLELSEHHGVADRVRMLPLSVLLSAEPNA